MSVAAWLIVGAAAVGLAAWVDYHYGALITREHDQWYVYDYENAGVGRTPLAAWRDYRAMGRARRGEDA